MNRNLLTLGLLFAAALGSPLLAQSPARHVGTVVLAGSHYTLAEFHDPNLRLESSLDLSPFLDEVVDLTGAVANSFTGPTQQFNVSTIVLSERAFSSDEIGHLGTTARLRVDAHGISNFFVHVSLGHGYVPLVSYGPTVAGVFWLDPSIVLSVAGGVMFDRWRGNIFVPNDPFLLGLTLHFQASVHQPGLPLLFLNSTAMTFAFQ